MNSPLSKYYTNPFIRGARKRRLRSSQGGLASVEKDWKACRIRGWNGRG